MSFDFKMVNSYCELNGKNYLDLNLYDLSEHTISLLSPRNCRGKK